LYDHIHNMQPQVLVSYKQGFLGTEDFMAPERHWKGTATKPLELCDTLQPKGWGYMEADNGNHKTPDQVMEMLTTAAALPANLLLNTGPLPDGTIHPEDVTTLREVGKRIARNGFPKG
jgi:alpha-L-fucosidase